MKLLAEGHGLLNDKVDRLKNRVGGLESRVGGMEKEMKGMKSDLAVVKYYIVGVDAKLNEHEIIRKRVKEYPGYTVAPE